MISRRELVIGTPAVLATGVILQVSPAIADTVAAGTPKPPTLRLLAESDRGIAAAGRLTNDVTPGFGFDVSELRPGDAVKFYIDGKLQSTHTVTEREILSGEIALGLPPLKDGANNITATLSRGQTESAPSNIENITIDRSITAPKIVLSAESAGKGGDRHRTSKTRINLTLTFAGSSTQVGDIVHLRRDGSEILKWTLERGELSSLTLLDATTLTPGRSYSYDAYVERTAARRLSAVSEPTTVNIVQSTQTVEITPTASDLIATSQTIYRHSIETGPEAPDRITIAKFMGRASPPNLAFAKVTLHVPDAASDPAGKPMTQVAVGSNNTGNSYLVGIFAVPNPTGTRGQIIVTYNKAAMRSFVQVEAMTGTGGNAAPHDAKGAAWAVSSNVGVPNRGAISVIAVVPGATSGTWNLARKEIDAPQGGPDGHTIAASGGFPTGGNPTISLKHDAKISIPASAFASWGPE